MSACYPMQITIEIIASNSGACNINTHAVRDNTAKKTVSRRIEYCRHLLKNTYQLPEESVLAMTGSISHTRSMENRYGQNPGTNAERKPMQPD